MNWENRLKTEQRNGNTMDIDRKEIKDIVELMNLEDHTVAASVKEVLPDIAKAIEHIVEKMKKGGRLFYLGAGTSGRLGILDASECPPTFGVDHTLVTPIIAGGTKAMIEAVEGAEDDEHQPAEDLKDHHFSKNDVLVGITASGRTPYVKGAFKYVKQIGASCILIACNKNAEISRYADYSIEVDTGPEVVTGSTRLKAATAQKMILNMMSTTTMIKLGKVYENLMVDLKVSNQKLMKRARNIVMVSTGVDYEQADNILNQTQQQVKPAIVMILTGANYEKACQLLEQADGFIHKAIKFVTKVD